MPHPGVPPIPPIVPPGAAFVFGASPFRAKGVLYRGTRGFFEENVQGGLDALVSEIEEPELREFISQPFLAGGWYDVLPVPALIAYEARALRMSLRDYLLHRSRYQAKRDLGGVYKWILRLASPRLVAARLPRIMTQMFDFVEAETKREEPGHVVVDLAGIPYTLQEWLYTAIAVYGETALKMAGVDHVDIVPPRSVTSGRRESIETVTMTYEVRWE